MEKETLHTDTDSNSDDDRIWQPMYTWVMIAGFSFILLLGLFTYIFNNP